MTGVVAHLTGRRVVDHVAVPVELEAGRLDHGQAAVPTFKRGRDPFVDGWAP